MIKNSTKKKEYKTPKVKFAEVQPRKVLCQSPEGYNADPNIDPDNNLGEI